MKNSRRFTHLVPPALRSVPYIEEDHELLVDLDISGVDISGEHDDTSRPYRDVKLKFWLVTECATEECESWLYQNPDVSAGWKIHDCFSYANDWEVEATRVSRW